jgi:AcrR family transcriptional regulator
MTEILQATCRVIARDGAGSLRMSDVAREAGVSTALVHYYSATRDELLAKAFSYADERAEARVAVQLASLERAIDKLVVLLGFYVGDGDDDVVHENAVLWRETWSHALFDEALRARLVASYAAWIDQVVDLIVAAQREGSVAADVDVEPAARRLAAIVDGLAAQILIRMLDGARATALIRGAIDLELQPATPTRPEDPD